MTSQTPTQSEKKYKTKAAQEYKRHLTKLQNDERGSGAISAEIAEATESNKTIATKWESASGLDDMMMSLSGKDEEGSSTPPSSGPAHVAQPTQPIHSFTPEVTAAPPAPVQVPEVKAASPAIVQNAAIGTLSVAAISGTVDEKDGFGDFDNMPTRVTKAPVFGKKSVAPKKSTATRIMSTSTTDARFESFESVEKRIVKAEQEAADHKIATQLQTQEDANSPASGGSSRLAAIYQESESTSIYRSPTAAASTSSSVYGSSKVTDSNGGSGGGNSTFNVAASSESYVARSKYSSNKGISSDQFFGRDEEDMELMKGRLNKLSTANAIGSDMLSNDDAANDWQSTDHRGGRGSGNAYSFSTTDMKSVNSSIDQLKDSVTNFIGDIQKRLA